MKGIYLFLLSIIIPGKENLVADSLSREFSSNLERSVDIDIFNHITNMTFVPDIDSFASRLNAKTDCFVWWHPEPGAMAVYAFSISWANLKCYAFPPFSLLTQVLAKICNHKALVLLTAPVWTTQNWYPLLLQLAVEQPILLPRKDNLLTLPHSQELHHLKDSLRLAAWMLSGDRLQSQSSVRLGPLGLINSTTQPGRNGGWCEQRKIDLLQASVDEVDNFLSQSFAEGKSSSTVNTYRSALSSTLYPVNNVAVGSHPLVVKLLKGMYHLRTPLPCHSSTWDVAKVTSYLRTLFPLEQLNLKTLTMKTVMLCALSSAQREQTLCALDLYLKKQSQDCLSFVIAEHLKTSKPGKSLEVKFMSLPEDPSTMSTLAEYILRTEKLCSSSKLSISFIRPHKPVTTSTVGRWIKSVLSSAGIGTSVFKAHSVRGASVTNAYIKGVPIAEILRTAHWTNERTFRNYYLKEHIALE